MIRILHADLPTLDAAIRGEGPLEAHLGARLAAGWLTLPDLAPALAYSREKLASEPAWLGWWTVLFLLEEPDQRPVVIGLGGYKGPPSAEGAVEIGYAIAESLRGRGLATDAARALAAYAFADPRVRCVEAQTLPEPNASTRVLEKIGMIRVGESSDPDVGVVWQWRMARAPR